MCLAVAVGEEVAICDSNTDTVAVNLYSRFITYLYSAGLSTLPITKPANCDEYADVNKGIQWALDHLSAPTVVVKEMGMGVTVDVEGRNAYCDSVTRNIENYHRGVQLTVNWPPELPQSFAQAPPTVVLTLQYDPAFQHDFVAKTYRTTVWTSVYLKPPAEGYVSPLYGLPPELFTHPVTFSSSGFRGMESYLVLAKNLLPKLMQVQTASGETAWGIATGGCRPPVFTLLMNWRKQVLLKCAQAVVRVSAITDEEQFECTMPYSSGMLLGQGPAQSRLTLQQLSFALAPRLGKILNSPSHVQSVLGCIFPVQQQQQFSKWGKASPSLPGACVACTQPSFKEGATPIPRACNRSAGETMDCCYSCPPGYSNLAYSNAQGQPQQHCVANCQPGYVFDKPTTLAPTCVRCPAGKFTASQKGGVCLTCAQLGVPNAFAGASACMPCGNRALATGDSASCRGCFTACSACPPQQYVPPGGLACQPCPSGSVLRLTECAPCPPGFYADANLGRCLQCPTNTYKSAEGAGACLPCLSGTQSVANRSVCVPCTDIVPSVAPFAIYKPNVSGCSAVCNSSVSFPQGTNPYAAGGCRPCTEVTVPIGMYPSPSNCAEFLHCLNVPAPNSTALLRYTGSGNRKGLCPWQCIPGYALKSDSFCIQCNASGFNPKVHVYTEGCAYACTPGLFYRGASNQDTTCNQRCVRLDTESVLQPRARAYYLISRSDGARTRLITNATGYVLGRCGSNATDAASPLAVVRRGGLYGYPLGSGGLCGDRMLNVGEGEECDDGNVQSGDGCSAHCRIERTDYWDCDVIGEPCLPQCGWPDLQGYALPEPPPFAAPWCAGISYQDFLQQAPADRGAWMQANLVACTCLSNPYQTLPYSECNYTNKGCRQCPTGQYQDDLYSRCTLCGGACPLAFRPFDAQVDMSNAEVKAKYGLPRLDLCGPSISTSQDLTFSDPVQAPLAFGIDQIKIGCVPCGAGQFNSPSQVVFVGAGCQWACRRDATNQSEPDYYCKTPLDASGACNQLCLDCDVSLRSLKPPSGWGWYIQPCQDGVGHTYARCSNLTDRNAMFTGNSAQVGDSGGCPWQCNPGFQLLRGRCVQCTAAPSCAQGEILQPCNAMPSLRYCAPCSILNGGPPAALLQVWYSSSDFARCEPDCERGYAFRATGNETCSLCTQLECGIDQLAVPCNQTTDAVCVPCPVLLPPHQEFHTPGTCWTRCSQGYAWDSDSNLCILCSGITCSDGHVLSAECQFPSERNSLPICIPCPSYDVDVPGRIWGIGCTTSCAGGWMKSENGSCIPCNVSGCALGQQGYCAYGRLHCQTCPQLIDKTRRFVYPGSCTTECESGYYQDSWGLCILLVLPNDWSITSLEQNETTQSSVLAAKGVSLMNISGLPARALPHS